MNRFASTVGPTVCLCVHIRTRFHHYSSYGTRDSSCINGEMFSGTVATVGRAATSLFPLMVDASFLVRRCCCRLGCSPFKWISGGKDPGRARVHHHRTTTTMTNGLDGLIRIACLCVFLLDGRERFSCNCLLAIPRQNTPLPSHKFYSVSDVKRLLYST